MTFSVRTHTELSTVRKFLVSEMVVSS